MGNKTNYPVLTGSQALKYYSKLKGRSPADWDFIMDHKKTFKKYNSRYFLDISDINDPLEKTNKIIYNKSQNGPLIDTPIGKAVVIPLNLLKVMKLSSLKLNKIKNKNDLRLLKNIKLSRNDLSILKKREKETELKIILQKNKFFNKYKIKRFFEHDELHFFINKKPLFLKIMKDSVNLDKQLFNNLSKKNKKLVFWEEAFVLSLERYLIPNVRNHPMFIDNFCDSFFKVKRSSDIGFYWLNKLCSKNKLKDNPKFLEDYGSANYNYIIKGFENWWIKTFNRLDKKFWIKLLEFN